MKRIVRVEKEQFDCDGCKYLLGLTKEEHESGVKLEDRITELKVPWDSSDEFLVFHFHSPAFKARSDCFRYWAHNPKIMQESLETRELHEDEIEEFMRIMLYRQDRFEPGIDKVTA